MLSLEEYLPILIFLGIFLFQYLGTYFHETTELVFNILLLIFLIYFIYTKISEKYKNIEKSKDQKQTSNPPKKHLNNLKTSNQQIRNITKSIIKNHNNPKKSENILNILKHLKHPLKT